MRIVISNNSSRSSTGTNTTTPRRPTVTRVDTTTFTMNGADFGGQSYPNIQASYTAYHHAPQGAASTYPATGAVSNFFQNAHNFSIKNMNYSGHTSASSGSFFENASNFTLGASSHSGTGPDHNFFNNASNFAVGTLNEMNPCANAFQNASNFVIGQHNIRNHGTDPRRSDLPKIWTFSATGDVIRSDSGLPCTPFTRKDGEAFMLPLGVNPQSIVKLYRIVEEQRGSEKEDEFVEGLVDFRVTNAGGGTTYDPQPSHRLPVLLATTSGLNGHIHATVHYLPGENTSNAVRHLKVVMAKGSIYVKIPSNFWSKGTLLAQVGEGSIRGKDSGWDGSKEKICLRVGSGTIDMGPNFIHRGYNTGWGHGRFDSTRPGDTLELRYRVYAYPRPTRSAFEVFNLGSRRFPGMPASSGRSYITVPNLCRSKAVLQLLGSSQASLPFITVHPYEYVDSTAPKILTPVAKSVGSPYTVRCRSRTLLGVKLEVDEECLTPWFSDEEGDESDDVEYPWFCEGEGPGLSEKVLQERNPPAGFREKTAKDQLINAKPWQYCDYWQLLVELFIATAGNALVTFKATAIRIRPAALYRHAYGRAAARPLIKHHSKSLRNIAMSGVTPQELSRTSIFECKNVVIGGKMVRDENGAEVFRDMNDAELHPRERQWDIRYSGHDTWDSEEDTEGYEQGERGATASPQVRSNGEDLPNASQVSGSRPAARQYQPSHSADRERQLRSVRRAIANPTDKAGIFSDLNCVNRNGEGFNQAVKRSKGGRSEGRPGQDNSRYWQGLPATTPNQAGPSQVLTPFVPEHPYHRMNEGCATQDPSEMSSQGYYGYRNGTSRTIGGYPYPSTQMPAGEWGITYGLESPFLQPHGDWMPRMPPHHEGYGQSMSRRHPPNIGPPRYYHGRSFHSGPFPPPHQPALYSSQVHHAAPVNRNPPRKLYPMVVDVTVDSRPIHNNGRFPTTNGSESIYGRVSFGPDLVGEYKLVSFYQSAHSHCLQIYPTLGDLHNRVSMDLTVCADSGCIYVHPSRWLGVGGSLCIETGSGWVAIERVRRWPGYLHAKVQCGRLEVDGVVSDYSEYSQSPTSQRETLGVSIKLNTKSGGVFVKIYD
ncbi:hypothetical protein NMY22_g7898 [Coprinellus aureogranulatus]|nr:hypothetical protein NMY22_g7898 [Coprinellus aureogranulatus]